MPLPADIFEFGADKGDAGRRLDHILLRRVTNISRLSRTAVQAWIESGAVLVDDVPVLKAAARVQEGSRVTVTFPPTAVRRTRPAAEPHPLVVVYEDEALLVVDKPPGIVVHPSYKQLSGTMLNAVLWRLRERTGVQPGVVTRLDKDTSGLVVVALTPGAHAIVQRDAAAGRVDKRYLAVVAGVPHPPCGRITAPLARDPSDRRRMMVSAAGAVSDTEYEVLSTADLDGTLMSLATCRLHTGRTHQIRVHLASHGWPVVGDSVYGHASPHIARQALHAWRIVLPHPVTRQPLMFESPLPEDMQGLCNGNEQFPPPDDLVSGR
jgi:23S rRNA pseudouridine1911/1915/1917 synthase